MNYYVYIFKSIRGEKLCILWYILCICRVEDFKASLRLKIKIELIKANLSKIQYFVGLYTTSSVT